MTDHVARAGSFRTRREVEDHLSVKQSQTFRGLGRGAYNSLSAAGLSNTVPVGHTIQKITTRFTEIANGILRPLPSRSIIRPPLPVNVIDWLFVLLDGGMAVKGKPTPPGPRLIISLPATTVVALAPLPIE